MTKLVKVLIGLYAACIILNSISSILNFVNNKPILGILYAFCVACWIFCLIIQLINNNIIKFRRKK